VDAIRDVESVETHRLYGEALLGSGMRKEALFEFESAVRCAGSPAELSGVHTRLAELLRQLAPDCVAIEDLFFATNVKSALKLGHARGVAMLAAVEAGVTVMEYTPAEVKRAVVGYGRAEKHQVQQMVKLILGLADVPAPHDVADALAVAICHVHSQRVPRTKPPGPARRAAGARATSWRTYRPAAPDARRRGKPARS